MTNLMTEALKDRLRTAAIAVPIILLLIFGGGIFGIALMVALAADSNEQVDAIYNAAIAAGGADEGAPGERGPGVYAGYFRDLDGNKLNVFYMPMG